MPGVSGSNSIYNGNTFSVFPKTPHLSDPPAGKSTGLAQLFQLDFQISELSDSLSCYLRETQAQPQEPLLCTLRNLD